MRVIYSVIRRALLLAGMGVLGTACSTSEPPQYGQAATHPASGLTGQRGTDATARPGDAGAVLVGLPGALDPAAPMGRQGEAGARGYTTAGAAGVSGSRGAGGLLGLGPGGSVGHWTAYREVNFMYDRYDIPPSQRSSIAEVAEHLARNPSLRVGIDNAVDPHGTDPRDPDLSVRRTDAVRDALVRAGVPPTRIQTGVSAEGQPPRDRRIGLVVSTTK